MHRAIPFQATDTADNADSYKEMKKMKCGFALTNEWNVLDRRHIDTASRPHVGSLTRLKLRDDSQPSRLLSTAIRGRDLMAGQADLEVIDSEVKKRVRPSADYS